jgi:hypothetical protein
MTAEQPTKADRLLQYVKNHRLGACLVAAGVVIIAVAEFGGAFHDLWRMVVPASHEAPPRILLIDSDPEVSTYRRRPTADQCSDLIEHCFPGEANYSAGASDVPYVFENTMVPATSIKLNADEIKSAISYQGETLIASEDPVFYLVVENSSSIAVTLLEVTATVYGHIGAQVMSLAPGPVRPVHDYTIQILPKPGVYHPDPNVLNPAIGLPANTAVALKVRIRRLESEGAWGSLYLVLSLDVRWGGGYVSSPKFLVEF